MFLSALLIAGSLLAVPDAPVLSLHVAPKGDDGNAGSLDAPLQSLEGARDRLRAERAKGLVGPAEVILLEGMHQLARPLELNASDGGDAMHTVTWRAQDGVRAVISGGRTITGWKKGERDRWSVVVPEAAKGAWPFRQLFKDGARLPRGRFPNGDELLRVSGVSENLTGIVLSEAPPVENLAEKQAELVMFQNWSISRSIVESSSGQTLKMKNPVGWVGHGDMTSASTGKPTYLENALEFVDAPGEWYLDRVTGTVTYQAAPGEDPNQHVFVAPVAEQLLKVTGTREKPVKALRFEGLEFIHTHWPLPEFGYMGIQAGHYGTTIKDPTYVLPAALQFIYAEDCVVRDSRLAHLGAGGVALGAGTRRNRIEHSIVEDIGGNGVMVGWRGLGEMSRQSDDEDGYLAADWANPADVPEGNVVTGNLVQRCAAVNHGCVGLFDAFARGTQLTHNVVRDLPYTGISVGFRWNETETSQRDTLIAFNHVHDTMKMLADGGCLYTLGYQPGTVIRGNVFHDAHRSEYAHGGAPNNGIFFDQGSKAIHVENNTIYDTSGEPIRFNQCSEASMTWGGNQLGIGRTTDQR